MSKTERAVKSSSSSSLSSLQRQIEGSRIPIRTISDDNISSSTSKISSSHSSSASNQQEQITQQQPNESNLRNNSSKDQLQMTNPSHNSEFEATAIKRELNDEAAKDEVINKLRNKN